MTSRSPKSTTEQTQSSKPPGGGTRRVLEVESKLREAVASGRFGVGEKLPTEPELTKLFDVSRSVLREAVAALRSDGLLDSRQGAGVFVLRKAVEPSPLALLTDANATLSGIIEELELRAAVEVEATALACVRASPGQLVEIQTRHRDFEHAVRNGTPTERADAELHRAISRATNNKRFETFLSHLGARTIPRAHLKQSLGMDLVQPRDEQLNREHQRIVAAILGGNAEKASNAMRAHLGGSIERYSKMAQRL